MPVCLALAQAQAVVAVLPTDVFTLLWTHSVERTEWREEWRIDDGRLRVVAATVAGSGAGMEPPPGAVLVDNAWHYVPAVPPMARLLLARGGPLLRRAASLGLLHRLARRAAAKGESACS